jgi:protein-S-isoprenylcysteine O-methyltransferase Ste14
MADTRKDLKSVILNIFAGLIVAIILASVNYLYNNQHLEFSWVVTNPLNVIENIYLRYSVPMRFNMFIWGMTFFIYFILNKYDKRFEIEKHRTIKEENFRSLTFILYSFFFTIGLIYLDKNISPDPIFDVVSNAVGLILTIIGFLILILGRVEIDGLWGPHVYEYSTPEYKKIIKSGIYNKMRHPIYFGQGTLALSTFIISQSLWFVMFPLLVTGINSFRAYVEERNLLQIFGAEYEDYKKEVNKWWLY